MRTKRKKVFDDIEPNKDGEFFKPNAGHHYKYRVYRCVVCGEGIFSKPYQICAMCKLLDKVVFP